MHTRNTDKNCIKVIYKKKGNVEEVGKYRPICTLPALYNLFSTIKKKDYIADSTKRNAESNNNTCAS